MVQRRIAPPSSADWEVQLSDEAKAYLRECHPQPDGRRQVVSRFKQIFDRLQRDGPRIGMPYVRKLRRNLWETRVDHPSGAHRLFFGVGPGRVLAFACGKAKKADRFHPDVYDWAEHKVNAYLAQLAQQKTRTVAHED